jgi:hypothetical protein
VDWDEEGEAGAVACHAKVAQDNAWSHKAIAGRAARTGTTR